MVTRGKCPNRKSSVHQFSTSIISALLDLLKSEPEENALNFVRSSLSRSTRLSIPNPGFKFISMISAWERTVPVQSNCVLFLSGVRHHLYIRMLSKCITHTNTINYSRLKLPSFQSIVEVVTITRIRLKMNTFNVLQKRLIQKTKEIANKEFVIRER